MNTAQSTRKRDRFKSLFKPKGYAHQAISSQTTSGPTGAPVVKDPAISDANTDDRQRTRAKYLDAAKMLEETVKAYEGRWGSFEFAELKGEPEDFNDSLFRDQINTLMDARRNDVSDQTTWEKCRHAVQCAFTAFSPFAKNFLTIMKEGQAIPALNPYGLLCGGLLLLIVIADKEIARKQELVRTLEYLSHQFAHLELVSVLPGDLKEREFVINRAMDVRSASMKYLAVSIRHDATRFGTPGTGLSYKRLTEIGRLAKTFFVGDTDIVASKAFLDECIENYSRALRDMAGIPMIIEVREMVKGLAALSLPNQKDGPTEFEDTFLVPNEANPRFIGRTSFLHALKEKLSEVAPKRYNHRIALYGMGGIGKTQCALGYVYANRGVYERIYWISTVDKSSLLSGYCNIAKAAKLRFQNTSTTEIATVVLSWLRRQRSWLLVIDNLDDIQVANGLLPENGPQKHTIITTRNPKTEGIPAEPFEVPLLDIEDSIDLLSTLSGIEVKLDSLEKDQAVEIVKKLGHLPLAIEQAAAYIREVTADFSAFLEVYEQNHKQLHMWVPDGNRQYPNSIATTWSMSFSLLQKYPAKLLRLFSFLNPDCILIEFLESGAEALEDELRDIISERTQMARALLELEKFSLIKWDRHKKSIIIHRLVQMVVSDEMSADESNSTLTNIINLFTQAFPTHTTNQTRSLCRTYQEQIIEPLTRMSTFCTLESARIRGRVGEFLREDGKYDDSERLLLKALEVYVSILGHENLETVHAMYELTLTYQAQGRSLDAARIQKDVTEKRSQIQGANHPETLIAMSGLALTYQAQGRYSDAAMIQEEVLEKRKSILGEEHPRTLTAMHNLAVIYQAQGRDTDAARILEQVLEKQKRILGEENLHLLTTMHALALMYQSQGRNRDATITQEEVLKKLMTILGEEHPHTLTAMHDLAWMYQAQGRDTDATRIQEEVLEKRRKILGEEHPHTLATMHDLACTYQLKGQNTDAAKILEEVLEKQKRILGEEHPDTLQAMHDLALTYQAQGRKMSAAKLQEKVLEKRSSILGEDHPQTLSALYRLAWTYLEQGRNSDAVRIQEKLLEKCRSIPGRTVPRPARGHARPRLNVRSTG